MSNDTTPAERAFEVHGTINLGYKPQTDDKAPRQLDIRTAGDTVTEAELDAVGMTGSDIESLITNGTISDPDAPTRPSLAPIYVAHNLAARLCKHFGLLKQKGADYTFGGKTYRGVQAFRDGVAVEHMEAAIRATRNESEN
ncbi:MAG TPA: hypothetical protein VFN10_22620 [Thermoanaerobaculia bacterium]|nr:hypothetical protein [Thermoanaerobaculia bacterium]